MHQFGIYDKSNLRKNVENILYSIGVDCPWRDIPEEFGPWNTIFQKFNPWSLKEKFCCSNGLCFFMVANMKCQQTLYSLLFFLIIGKIKKFFLLLFISTLLMA